MPELLKKYLNEQLYSEYEAMYNYLFYSAKVADKNIKEQFEEFSRQEFEHARLLIRYIYELGGEPVHPNCIVDTGDDLVELLIKSVAAEDAAINTYIMVEQIIENSRYKSIIRDTINIEKLHYQKLTDILESVKQHLQEAGNG